MKVIHHGPEVASPSARRIHREAFRKDLEGWP